MKLLRMDLSTSESGLYKVWDMTPYVSNRYLALKRIPYKSSNKFEKSDGFGF